MAFFSELLKAARLAAGASSQRAAAEKIRKYKKKVNTRTVSQSLIAQYETMRVADPDPEILALLAQVYSIDYMELIWALARDKYEPSDKLTPSEISDARWELWKASLKRFSEVGRVSSDVDGSLEANQLAAKADLIQRQEILDLNGIAKWQREFRPLGELWIFVPDFQDEREPIRSVVVEHLQAKVTMLYFIRATEIGEGQRFTLTQRRLAELAGLSFNDVKRSMIGIPLTEDEMRFIHTDLVIANPLIIDGAVGFRLINFGESDQRTIFGVRIGDPELQKIVHRLTPWVDRKKKESNVSTPFVLDPPALEHESEYQN